jgi:HEAT repeat protein|mmetsp:Transcript_94533/g.147799  ORF Transcript_94533/g.147799 Transcript_94533/m.147799 type:complete len:535 (-) Transcript_94533:166-1770(-)
MAATMVGYANPDRVEELFGVLYSGSSAARVAALRELGSMGEATAEYGTAQRIVELFHDYDLSVQTAAVSALRGMGELARIHSGDVASMLNSGDKEVQQASLQTLGYIGGAMHAALVEAYLDHQDLDLVVDACAAIGRMGATSGVEQKLKAKLKDSDQSVVAAAAAGLCMLGADGFSDLLGAKGSTKAKVSILQALLEKGAADENLFAPIATLVGDGDSEVRISAAKFIGLIGEKAATSIVVNALTPLLASPDVGVKACAASALGYLGEKASSVAAKALEQPLASLLGDEGEDKSSLLLSTAGVRPKVSANFRKPACAAAFALGALKAYSSAGDVAECMKSKDFEIRIASAQAISSMGGKGAGFTDELMKLAEDPNPQVVASACLALGALAESTPPSSAAAEKLAECLKDKLPTVRAAACRGLAKMGDEATNYLDGLVKCLNDQIWSVRAAACEGVAGCGEMGQMYASDICRLIFDNDTRVRITAVETLVKMGERGAAFAEEVSALLDDPVPGVRDAGYKALQQFGVGETLYLQN